MVISCEVGSFEGEAIEEEKGIRDLVDCCQEGKNARKLGLLLFCKDSESLKVVEKAPVKPVYL